MGALDGTHILVTVSAEDRPRYRNRKGDISTNVLGPRIICFKSQVISIILWMRHMLMDNVFLAPYKGTRYHIDDVSPNSSCPKKRNQPSSYIRPPKKRDEQLKACTWFIENEKQFLMLKTLPVETKNGMVLMFISPRA
ncbi:hypothetical protein L3X38_003997 [Prunus dulcis]|uniref:DDE Tnp4 domain-containing protein n=1 Tax=Prunus dulcis TaxID=3755 RepID=A0AAD5F2P5_PRUDU|nr:hypothetical protein L3X38_003997 [Prunus dulcis]